MRQPRLQGRTHGDRGIALMVVIWIVGMLALQVALFNGSVRDAVRLAENETALARGEMLARAAVEVVAARLLAIDQRERWQPDGRVVELIYGGSTIRVKLTDERSRINLNYADEPLLKGLFRVVTGSSLEAGRLAARFVEWRRSESRPSASTTLRRTDSQLPDQKLFDPADIGRVLDTSPALIRDLLPFVTIYGPDSKINPVIASETVLRALPDLTPQNLELALAARGRARDPAALEAALATSRGRLVFRTGNIVRLEIEIVGGVPMAIGGAEVILATGIDAAAPHRIIVWRPRAYNGSVSLNTDVIGFNESAGDREKAKTP